MRTEGARAAARTEGARPRFFLHRSPASTSEKPDTPHTRSTLAYGLAIHFSHQFHALVSRPSMQEPASNHESAPDPSKPCRKKSARMTVRHSSSPPNLRVT